MGSGDARERGARLPTRVCLDEKTMAIQFACEACGKPIEVDDELAGQLAVCPYCRATVRAPQQAAPGAALGPQRAGLSGPPGTSAPITSPALGVPASESPVVAVPPPAPLAGNRPGNWGLALGIVAWIAVVLTFGYIISQLTAVLVTEDYDQVGPEQVSEALVEIQKDPAKAKMIALGSGVMLFSAVAGVILCIAGLRKKQARKGTAIAGLVISGTLLMCHLLSIFLKVPVAGGGG